MLRQFDYNKAYIQCFDWSFGISDLVGAGLSIWNNERSISSAKDQLKSEQKFNAEQAQLNRDFQTSERLAAQEYNLDMWNMQNEYNSPLSQMERLKAAGINPSVAFGNGNLANSAGAIPASSPMSGATASTPSIASTLVANGMQLSELIAKTDNIKADTELKKQTKEFNDLSQPVQLDLMKQELKNAMKEFNLKDVEYRQAEEALEWYSRLQEGEWEVKKNQAILLYNQAQHELKKMDNTLADTAIKKEQKELVDQQTYESMHRVKLIDEQAANYQSQNELLRYEKALCDVLGVPTGTPGAEFLFYLWQKGDLESFMEYMTTQAAATFSQELGNSIGDVDIVSKLFGKLKGFFNPSDESGNSKKRRKK